MSETLKNIRSIPIKELEELFVEIDEPKFRAKQIHDWLWKKNASTYEEMTNLPKDLREKLQHLFAIHKLSIGDKQISNDGTIKYAFDLFDKKVVEGVLIPTSERKTACISSQVGCSLTCKFCATSKLKRMRNLGADEIYDQVVNINQDSEEYYQQRLTNIVYMGMGEPLLNYNNVLESIRMLTSEEGLGMSPKRITVSTAGIAKMITKMADDEVKFNLALSLHAANDTKRNEIMPINESNNLEALKESIRYFYQATGTRLTYEYIIFKGFNDTLKDAEELADFCRITPCKVNIIEYNPIDDGEFEQADVAKINRFANYLSEKNLIINIRRSRGKDIDAACGQLANKNELVSD